MTQIRFFCDKILNFLHHHCSTVFIYISIFFSHSFIITIFCHDDIFLFLSSSRNCLMMIWKTLMQIFSKKNFLISFSSFFFSSSHFPQNSSLNLLLPSPVLIFFDFPFYLQTLPTIPPPPLLLDSFHCFFHHSCSVHFFFLKKILLPFLKRPLLLHLHLLLHLPSLLIHISLIMRFLFNNYFLYLIFDYPSHIPNTY